MSPLVSLRPAILLMALAPGAEAGPADWTPQQLQALWVEACYTFNGFSYTCNLAYFPDKPRAEAYRKAPFLSANAPAAKARLSQRYNEFPPEIRSQLSILQESEYSDPFFHAAKQAWAVLEVESMEKATFGKEVSPRAWLDAFAVGALPSPEALAQDRALVLRTRLNRAGSLAELKDVIEGVSLPPGALDRPLSNGFTVLHRFIASRDIAAAEYLLGKGANPDQPSFAFLPLTAAIYSGSRPMIDLLLRYHAAPGGKGPWLPPLMAACSTGDLDLAQRLLRGGADPLKGYLERDGLGRLASVLSYVPSRNQEMYAFMKQEIDRRLTLSGEGEWEGWLLQNGKRHRLSAGADIALDRAPFKLHLRYRPGVSLAVIGLREGTFAEALSQRESRLALIGIGKTSAISPSANWLVLNEQLYDKGRSTPMQVFQNLGSFPDLPNGVRPIQAGQETWYEYPVEKLVMNSNGDSQEWEGLVKDYPQEGFSLLLGTLQAIGLGQDFYRDPVTVRVHFKRP
ncbi:MAG: Ankyrin repeat (3 copies) [Holophagaceae bacterium]|nr:Ankyrin repeat (3 copies) [Holophagaceae bacterium]